MSVYKIHSEVIDIQGYWLKPTCVPSVACARAAVTLKFICDPDTWRANNITPVLGVWPQDLRCRAIVANTRGIFTLAVYVHYFIPGSLKIQTKLYTVPLGHLRELIDDPVPDPLRFMITRRWLPKGEAPYPGYCRAPGSGQCVPALCNCQKLKEKWNKVVLKNMAIKEMQQNKTANVLIS